MTVQLMQPESPEAEASKLTSEIMGNHTAETSRLVSGPRLLEILFDKESRPSLCWLRLQQRARTVPFKKVGRFVFFDPVEVRERFEKKHTVRARAV